LGNFARALHHLDMKDVKKKRLEEIAAQKLKEKKDREEKKIIQEISKKYKSDWKREIYEGMNTSNALTMTVAPAEGDGTVTAVDVIDASSYSGTVTGMLGADAKSGNTGSVIRDSGSGSGQDGGFDVGGKYLSFQGDGYNVSGHAIRWAALAPIDSSRINSLSITAIVGNDSNGGEDPDATLEDLRVMYKTSSMSSFAFLNINPNGPNGATDSDVIIPLGASGNSGLNNYSVKIPEYARGKNTEFVLIQTVSSGTGFDNYGITDIKFQRTTPVNVVVPLDDPQAISFVRVGSDEGDPKKRKKKLNDQLAASDEYTQAQLGDDFPGRGARVGGDDPFASAKIGDDVKPSPIGKAEVKKSFSDFSAAAATSEPEPTEPESTSPSTSTSLEPTNDDGDPIPVKPVGKIAVQGPDAADLDAQDPEPTEPKPTEPEPEIPDPDPEEVKEPPDENKTPEEIEEIENEKVNQQLDQRAGVINDKILDFIASIDPLDTTVDAFMDGVAGFIRLGKGILQLGSFVEKLYGGDWFKNAALKSEKLFNDMQIFRSNLTGKIENHNYSPGQIKQLANLVTPLSLNSNVKGLGPYTSQQSWGISDTRHEYVDDNIYVKDGKVYNNNEGLKSLASYNTGAIAVDGIGKGYGQMIIPKDGSQPYFHFYDYNYLNLNSKDVAADGSLVGAEVPSLIQMFGANVAGFLRSILPGRLTDDVINTLKGNIDTFGKGLKDRVGLDGWPPGIHGAALTDFKIPLDQLPKETQEMIAAHPLSWTPERMANMSEEEIYEQFYSLENIDYNDYSEYLSDITRMPTEPVNTVPYAVAMQEMDKVSEQYQNALLEKYGEDGWEEFSSGLNRDTSDFFAAERAALEDLETLETEERKELDENESIRGTQVRLDLWDELVKPAYDAFVKATTGGSVSGDSPIVKRLEKQHAKYKKQRDKMEDDYFKIQGEIKDRYRDQREPIKDIAYAQLTTLREPVKDSPFGQARWKTVNYDGDEIAGADYTALDGTVYKGKNTYYDEYYDTQEQTYFQIEELYDPVADLQKYVDGNYVREAKIKEFSEKYKTISPDSWTPKKKGSGRRSTPDKPKPKPKPRSGSGTIAGLDEPLVIDRNKKNTNEEILLKYARPQPKRDLFERLKQKQFFNPNDIKPTFPENPPPQLDPKTGMHPNYGKHAKRYKKLDPASANAMPPTGDPETDAIVDKQRTKPKTKLYDKLKKNIRKDLTNK